MEPVTTMSIADCGLLIDGLPIDGLLIDRLLIVDC